MGASWGRIYGVALLWGIGFTISLIISGRAFSGGLNETEAKLGVLGGSLLSGVLGALMLLLTIQTAKPAR